MGLDAQYKIRFASEEAARSAIEQMGGEPKYSVIGRENHYYIESGYVELTARPSWEDKSVVVVGTLNRFFPWGRYEGPGESVAYADRANTVLDDLEYLVALPVLADETIYYGTDHDEEDELGMAVTPEFMDGLRKFVASLDD